MAEYEHQGHGRAWAGSSDDQREHDTSRRHRRRWESGNDSRERRRSRSHSPRRYKAQPSSCVIIRGLDPSTTEQDVQAALAPLETPSHLRLVRDHGTGAARFAFAEFGTVERAESVLAAAGESFHVRGAPVHLDFSHSRNRPQGQWRDKRDWTCCRCKGLNFARRQACFKCSHPRCDQCTANAEGYIRRGMAKAAIRVQGLDPSTTSESIQRTFSQFVSVSGVELKVESPGTALVYFASDQDAMVAIQNSVMLMIDGRPVRVEMANSHGSGTAYRGNTFPGVSGGHAPMMRTLDPSLSVGLGDAMGYNTNTAQLSHRAHPLDPHEGYDQDPYATESSERWRRRSSRSRSPSRERERRDRGPGRDRDRFDDRDSDRSRRRHHRDDDGHGPKRPPYLSAEFKWDSASGKWYDRNSDFYFDVTSQLYRHGASGLHYRWNIGTGSYVQVDERGVAVSQQPGAAQPSVNVDLQQHALAHARAQVEAQSQRLLQKRMGVESAKVVVPPWERNAGAPAAPSTKQTAPPGPSAPEPKTLSAAKPREDPGSVGPANQGQRKVVAAGFGRRGRKAVKGPTPLTNIKFSITPASSSSESPHLDLGRVLCLLCKRKFKSVAVLKKHAEASKLHKSNLLAYEERQNAAQSGDTAPKKKGKDGLAPDHGQAQHTDTTDPRPSEEVGGSDDPTGKRDRHRFEAEEETADSEAKGPSILETYLPRKKQRKTNDTTPYLEAMSQLGVDPSTMDTDHVRPLMK